MGDYDVEKAKAAIKKKLRDRERKERARQLKRWSVAASFLLVLGLSLYLTLDWEKMREPAAAEIITSGASRAVLTLGDGEEVALAQGQGYRATDINSNGIELVYEGKGTKKPTQNYLTVPRGGQFVLNLADGTKVWVNSESKLKYPTRFVAGETRNVELLYGEAYFEVSPSEQHEGDRFSVLTKGQKIVVLGTKFNVQAHRGDAEVITTLTEGRVVVERGAFTESLVPNQRSIIDDDTQEISVEAANAEAAISWSKGLFTFEQTTLREMTEDLGRWYNVEVFFETKEIAEIPFTGVLERTSTLNELLEIIEESSGGDFEYELKNRELLFKERRKG